MKTVLADWLTVAPALLLVIGALAVVGVESFVRRDWRHAAGELLAYLALTGALVAVFSRLYAPLGPAFKGAVILDPLASLLSLGVISATGLMLVLTGDLV